MRTIQLHRVFLASFAAVAAAACVEPAPSDPAQADDAPDVAVTEQAFSEARCITATPDVVYSGRVPGRTIRIPIAPGGFITRVLPGQEVSAGYHNARCYRTFVIELDHTQLRAPFIEVEATGVSQQDCDSSVVALQVFSRSMVRMGIPGQIIERWSGWGEIGLIEGSGSWTGSYCLVRAEMATPALDPLHGIIHDRDFRIFITGRDVDNNTLGLWFNAQ